METLTPQPGDPQSQHGAWKPVRQESTKTLGKTAQSAQHLLLEIMLHEGGSLPVSKYSVFRESEG